MVFVQGSYDAPTIVATIAQALDATDDFEIHDENAVDNHNHSGYCMKHIPTGQFITFVPGYSQHSCYANRNFNEDRKFNTGIRVIFSGSWNLETHTYSGNKIYRGMIPLYGGNQTNVNTLISPNVFSTSLHIDKYGVVGTIQNTYSDGIGAFVALEFFPQAWVEYDDTEEIAAILYCKRSRDNWNQSPISMNTPNRPAEGHPDEGFYYVRPYRFMCQTYASNGNGLGGLGQHEGSFMEREAFRSEANNKVHFKFPMYENDVFAGRKPYAETRRWFKVSITGGLQIGDILNWIDPDGVTVHKFIVAVVTAGAMYYAIPYANPFDYAVSAKQ